MKKKVCKNCKMFVKEDTCPICKRAEFSTNWQGRLYIFDHKKSQVAEKVGVEVNGEYAIKSR